MRLHMSVWYVRSQGGSGTLLKQKLIMVSPQRSCGTSHQFLDFKEYLIEKKHQICWFGLLNMHLRMGCCDIL